MVMQIQLAVTEVHGHSKQAKDECFGELGCEAWATTVNRLTSIGQEGWQVRSKRRIHPKDV